MDPPPAEGVHWVRREGETSSFPPAVWAAAWSPGGQELLTGSRDGSARVWRAVQTQSRGGGGGGGGPLQWRLQAVLRGHVGAVWSVAWAPDGSRLLTAGDDGAARVWRRRSGGGGGGEN